MLAETVDAVIGTGTHRDTYEVEIADPAGKPIAVLRIANDGAGFAAARRDRRGGARAAGGGVHGGQPQLRDRGETSSDCGTRT